MTRLALALIVGFVLSGVDASAAMQKKDVDIKAADGVNLKGTYFSPGGAGPAILLLHQCNMDRHAWDGLANDLASAGFHVLTLDYRGYGDSGDKTEDPAQRKIAQSKWPGDVDIAFEYLLAQQGVDKGRLAAGGASCGVGQSSALASRRPQIKVLLELSGTPSAESLAYVSNTPALAVFGAAAEGDETPAKNIRALLGASKNEHSMLKMYPGKEHGVPLFAVNAELQPMVVNWLKTQLAHSGH